MERAPDCFLKNAGVAPYPKRDESLAGFIMCRNASFTQEIAFLWVQSSKVEINRIPDWYLDIYLIQFKDTKTLFWFP